MELSEDKDDVSKGIVDVKVRRARLVTKQRVCYTVDAKLAEDFRLYCEQNHIKASRAVETLLRFFMKKISKKIQEGS